MSCRTLNDYRIHSAALKNIKEKVWVYHFLASFIIISSFSISAMIILAHMLLTTLAVCLSVPKIVYNSSYSSYSYSAFPNDTCQQI